MTDPQISDINIDPENYPYINNLIIIDKPDDLNCQYVNFIKHAKTATEADNANIENVLYIDNIICKPYVKFEFTCDVSSYYASIGHYERSALNKMKLMIEYIRTASNKLLKNEPFEIKIAKSHGFITRNNCQMHKFAFYFVVNCKYRFHTNVNAIQLVNLIESDYNTEHNVIKFIDKSVYSKNYRENDNLFLELIDPCGDPININDINDTIYDYFISHVPDFYNISFIKNDDEHNNMLKTPKNNTTAFLKRFAKGPIDEEIFNGFNEDAVVLKCITNIIPSARVIKSGPGKFTKMLYNYEYNHMNDTCIHGAKHNTNEGFAYVFESNICAGCYDRSCRIFTNKRIGKINIFEENWNLPNIVHFNSEYISNDKRINNIIHDFVTNDAIKILAIKSNMKTGKTQNTANIFDLCFKTYGEQTRVLIISIRQSFAKDIVNNAFKKFNFTNYMNVSRCDLPNASRLVISLESLHKLFVSDVKAFDVILLDECESLLIQFFSSTISSNRECLNIFNIFMRHASKIISLDADISLKRSIQYLNSITNKILILKNNYKGPPRQFIITNNMPKYKKNIDDDIIAMKNISIITTSKAFGRQMQDELLIKYPNLKKQICFINGDSDKLVKNELSNVNMNWTQYRVLIYNTAIGQGVDYSVFGHFNKIYAYLIGNICSAKDFLQMIGRIRNPIESDVITLIGKNVNTRTDTTLYTHSYSQQHCYKLMPSANVDKLIMTYKDGGSIKIHIEIMDTIWNMLIASFIQERYFNSHNKNILAMLRNIIDNNGDKFIEDYDYVNITEKSTAISIEQSLNTISNAKNINDEECKLLINKPHVDLSQDEIYSIKRAQMRQQQYLNENTPKQILDECITDYIKNKRTIEYIQKVVQKQDKNMGLKLNDANTKNVNTKNIDVKNNVINDIEIQKLKHYRFALKKALKMFDYEDGTDRKKFSSDEFATLTKDVKFSTDEINSLNSDGKMNDMYQICKTIFSRIGVVFSTDPFRVRINGKQKWDKTYILHRDPNIYSIVYNIIGGDHNIYEKTFIDMLNYYNEYQEYSTNKKQIKNNATNDIDKKIRDAIAKNKLAIKDANQKKDKKDKKEIKTEVKKEIKKEVTKYNKKRQCIGVEGKCPYDKMINDDEYDGYCKYCFCYLFPVDSRIKNIKIRSKETTVINHVCNNHKGKYYHDIPMQINFDDGCCVTRRRIDLRQIIGNTILCIEVDENQHKYYPKNDDFERYNQIVLSFTSKYIFIRYNPDKYKRNGIVINTDTTTRLKALSNEINKQIQRINSNENTDLLEIIHMYYDD